MLILLPPSEGKYAPKRGKRLDLATLSFPELTAARTEMLSALIELCRTRPEAAGKTLGLGPTQADAITRNVELLTAPTARAEQVYTGVLFEALGLADLDAAARRRAARSLLIASAAFGVLRPGDRIPAYRLSGNTTLPGFGTVSSHWKAALTPVLDAAAGNHLIVDLRSGTYQGFWKPPTGWVSLRVLHEVNGERKVVSHFNKATKGRIARDLLTSGARPRNISAFSGTLADLGWQVEADGARVDVIVTEV